MSKLLLLVSFFTLFSHTSANPGVKIVVTQKAFDYAAKKVVDILANEVPKMNFPSLKKMTENNELIYEVNNLILSSFTKPTASIKINPGIGLTIKLKNGGVKIGGRWSIMKSKSSELEASFSDINLQMGVKILEVNGIPVLSAMSCIANPKVFKLNTTGKIEWLLIHIITDFFNNNISNIVEKEICKSLTKIVNKNANDELSTFNLVAKINNDIQIDYHMTQQPTFHLSYLISTHKGNFLFDPVFNFLPAPLGLSLRRMVSTSISQETLKSLGRVFHSKKLFDFRFTVTDKVFKKVGKNLNLNKFNINTHVYSTSAPIVIISPSKLSVKVAVDAEFVVSKLVLRLGIKVEATCTVKAEGVKLKGEVSDIKLDVKMKYNGIGQTMTDEVMNEIANDVLPFLLPFVNKKLYEGIPLPKIKHVTVPKYFVEFFHKYIIIRYDFQ